MLISEELERGTGCNLELKFSSEPALSIGVDITALHGFAIMLRLEKVT